MVQWAVSDMGGEIPRRDSVLLPDNMAEEAVNVDLNAGTLTGLPQPEGVISLAGAAPFEVRRAYRLPGPTPGDPDVWIPLPSEFSSVCRSPLANDTYHRIYWTNPPGQPSPGAFWNTYDRLRTGQPPYNIGFIPPSTGIALTVSAVGGTTSVPQIGRSYVLTYVDSYNQESSPTLPSPVVEGAPDATWTLAGIPTGVPANPPGKVYPPVVKMRVYRTLTGASTGAQFYFVTDLSFGSATFTDTIPDTTVVNNNLLETASWAPPLDGLDGLLEMTGGMLVGFSENTIHFSEPDRPHTWPAGYDQSLIYPIVGLAIWQQALIVLTKGYPSSGTGSSPAQFMFMQIQAPEPCIARGSIVTDLAGVYYASQNGLVMLSYYGMQNQTLSNMTKNLWLEDFRAEHIVACRHRASYLAVNGTGLGFLIDYTEQRMGIMHIAPVVDVVSVWNDAFNGDAYMVANQVVYRWDSPTTPPLTYRWRSKQFYLPAPVSLGACQITLDATTVTALTPMNISPELRSGDPGSVLPPGVNAIFRLFIAGELVHTEYLTRPLMIFRLPSGRKSFAWQFEIVANCGVSSVELASTMRELKGV